MASTSDIIATLGLLAPGFIALKTFYLLGLRTKRSDAEWALWSIIWSAPISLIAAAASRTTIASISTSEALPVAFLGWAIVLALLAGVLASLGWRATAERWQALRSSASLTTWDSVLSTPHWVEIWTEQGVISGRVREIASTAETDGADIYVDEPAWVNTATGATTAMTGLAGVWVARDQIHLIQVHTG